MASFQANRESSKIGIFLVLILVIVIFVISFIVGGVQGIFGVLKFFLTISLIVVFFGFVFYIIYFLFFKKHRRDIPYENWKSYMRSAKDNGADMMENLILTGDKYHSSKVFMKIMGYLRIQAFDGKEYDLFVGKRKPMNPFEEEKIIMLQDKEHSDLIGDVYVYGISLIQKYGYYFLNSTMMDFNAIDKSVANDTYRSLIYETLGDMKGILDRAVGLDSEFAKNRMEQKLLKIPILSGQSKEEEK